jgi:hypothetical protein
MKHSANGRRRKERAKEKHETRGERETDERMAE